MSRNVCITAVEGHTGFVITELLLTNDLFKKEIGSVVGLAIDPNAPHCKELADKGATIMPHKPGRVREVVSTLQNTKADTLCLIPPAHGSKADVTFELIEASKRAGIRNVCFLSAAGCDLAERSTQPRLREFIDLEAEFLKIKGDPNTNPLYSPVVIRAGFYAENLLLYAPQAQEEGLLPIPIGYNHKFPPVALGDVAQLVAHVLTSKGKHGFSDQVRGQLIVLTGPTLVNGEELARIASKTLGTEMRFEDISENEARRVLRQQGDADDAEIQYILEYYSLVHQGKTNYLSTAAFHDITGNYPVEPPEFFNMYKEEFLPKRANKQRKIDGK